MVSLTTPQWLMAFLQTTVKELTLLESSVGLMTLLQKDHSGVVEEAVVDHSGVVEEAMVSLTTPLWLMAFLQTTVKELPLLESSVGLMTLLQKDHSGVVEETKVSLTTPLWLMALLQTTVNNPG